LSELTSYAQACNVILKHGCVRDEANSGLTDLTGTKDGLEKPVSRLLGCPLSSQKRNLVSDAKLESQITKPRQRFSTKTTQTEE